MNEASKIRERWKLEGLWDRYIIPPILDVGAGKDPICEEAEIYDIPQGDAQTLVGVEQKYNTVFSSHCIEHMRDPAVALINWWRVLLPGGHLLIIGPDEDLYEQGLWPSLANGDHKRTCTLSKYHSWSPDSVNLIELITSLPDHKLISARIVDTNYDYSKQAKVINGQVAFVDQTQLGAETNIEIIAQKLVWQPEWVPTYNNMLSCSECGWSRLILEGWNGENKIIVRCEKCGNKGIFIP